MNLFADENKTQQMDKNIFEGTLEFRPNLALDKNQIYVINL